MTDSANLISILLREEGSRIVADGVVTPVSALRSEAGVWAGHLRERHPRGSHIGLVSRNDVSFVTSYLACLAAGMVAVPMNPSSPDAERRRDLQSVALVEMLLGPSALGHLESVQAAAPDMDVTVMDPMNATGSPIDPLADAAAVNPDDAAVLLFTSGTAGASKPAILTHRNLRASLLSIKASDIDLTSEPQATVAVVPLFHVLGLNVILNLGLAIGATIVLHDEFDASLLLRQVAEHKVTILGGPPNMWRALSRLDPAQTAPLQGLNVALSGAATLDPNIARIMRAQHHVDLREGYGLTETSGILCSGFGTDYVDVGSVGPVMPGVEVRLVDADENDVLVGDIGEVWVRGPMVSPGYWHDDAATARTRADGDWFRTGDLASVDDDGHLSISGRTKDLVIVSGFNVHPAEVENVLQAHPAVEAAAVVGVVDNATGERVNAFVTLNEGVSRSGVEDELRAHCQNNLARYKVPARIDIVDELPIGIAGKLRRRDLAN
ncbi:MAG: acyl--CoA ligase [Acidimicrobiales bacterium]|nr:acyl--CoA ligase [Acidimicrobiales bacterium]